LRKIGNIQLQNTAEQSLSHNNDIITRKCIWRIYNNDHKQCTTNKTGAVVLIMNNIHCDKML